MIMAGISYRKRGDKWEYRFEGAKVNGKRKQISKGGFSTKKEASIAAAKAYDEYHNSGNVFTPSEISVADYLDYWFDAECKVNLAYNTQLSYLSIIENHLKPRFGKYKLKSLNSAAIQEMIVELKTNGLAKTTVKGVLSVLRLSLDYAIEPLGYIAVNPVDKVKIPKFEKNPYERVVLTNEEFERIIERFPADSRFHIPLMIGYYTGLRISECFGLTWDDIDLKKRTISVNKQSVKRNYGVDVRRVLDEKGKKEEKSSWYLTDKLKTRTSKRTVKFGDTLYQALMHEKEKQKKAEELYGDFYTIHVLKPEDDGRGNTIYRIVPVQKCIKAQYPRCYLICISENGEYTSTDSFKYCSRVVRLNLHIAFDYHSLRHTHATRLIESGASVKAVSARLGHKDIETTLNIYVHNTEQMEDDTVEIFEQAVSVKKEASNSSESVDKK